MTALPTNISFGKVRGRFGSPILSAGDADGLPDFQPLTGLEVTFTPKPDVILNLGASPVPVTFLTENITCTLDDDGYLVGPDGREGVNLIATDDTDLAPSGWTYKVSFGGNLATYKRLATFDISVPADSTRWLTAIAPVPSSSGVSTLDAVQAAILQMEVAISEVHTQADSAASSASAAATSATAATTAKNNAASAATAANLASGTAGAAAASLAALASTMTLVAGPNVTIDNPTSSTVRVSAATASAGLGNPAALFTVPRAVLGASPAGVAMTSGTLRLSFFTCPVNKTWTKLRTLDVLNSFNTPTLQRMGLYELLPGGTLSLVGSTVSDSTTLWRTANTGYSVSMSAPVTTTAGTTYAIGALVVSANGVATLAYVPLNSGESIIGDPEAAFSTGHTDLPASVTSANYFATTAKVYAALIA